MDDVMDYTKTIDVKQAIETALTYLRTCYPESARIQLEETEITDDKKNWNITLSYEEVEPGYIVLGGRRKFKIFKIDAEKNEVLAMKIREL